MTQGTKHTAEAIQKMRDSHRGAVAWNKGLTNWMSPEGRARMVAAKVGKKHTLEHRLRISAGAKRVVEEGRHNNYLGGITKTRLRGDRETMEYRLWRESVFERDDYTCVLCGERNGDHNADHIKPYALFPELRFAIDNGRTLCVPCHRKTDTYGIGSVRKYANPSLV